LPGPARHQCQMPLQIDVHDDHATENRPGITARAVLFGRVEAQFLFRLSSYSN
jgi:hypothetical protein